MGENTKTDFTLIFRTRRISQESRCAMTKFVILMTLFMTMREVQLQRSPYAGSANKFRGQPVNIVPVQSSMEILPSTAAQARRIDLTTILTTTTTTTTTTQQPGKQITVRGLSLPSRISTEFISNRNQDQYRDYDHHHHSHRHHYRGERDFDYNFYD